MCPLPVVSSASTTLPAGESADVAIARLEFNLAEHKQSLRRIVPIRFPRTLRDVADIVP